MFSAHHLAQNVGRQKGILHFKVGWALLSFAQKNLFFLLMGMIHVFLLHLFEKLYTIYECLPFNAQY
jgi:hypothetical protein